MIRFCLLPQYRWVSNQLFQLPTATNSATVASTGLHSGKMICQKIRKSPAPSILADSTSASGKFEKADTQIIGLGRLADIEDIYVAHAKVTIDSLQ